MGRARPHDRPRCASLIRADALRSVLNCPKLVFSNNKPQCITLKQCYLRFVPNLELGVVHRLEWSWPSRSVVGSGPCHSSAGRTTWTLRLGGNLSACLSYCCHVVSFFTRTAKAAEVSSLRQSLHPASTPKFLLPTSSAHAMDLQRLRHRQAYHLICNCFKVKA